MNADTLRAVAQYLEGLANLEEATGLHLYITHDSVFVEDGEGDSLVKLAYDSEDGYTAEAA